MSELSIGEPYELYLEAILAAVATGDSLPVAVPRASKLASLQCGAFDSIRRASGPGRGSFWKESRQCDIDRVLA